MKIEQIYTGCLAQGAYYIESDGQAAIIDPLRETKPYIERLQANKVQLKYIFETHFHADFVSGHIDLSAQTGAKIVYGPQAHTNFEAIHATDNQEFKVGKLTLRVLHTPGHTLESTCYLLLDEQQQPTALFSGDTLFLGDVGRPDLAQKAANITQEELAGMLYDSLYQKIMPLPNHITVYPAHGAGSACGKNMMKETFDSLGNQKAVNYALNQPNKAAFIAAVTEGLTAPPAYFGMNVAMNKNGYANFDTVLNRGMEALSLSAFEAAVAHSGAIILDTRPNQDFALGHIPQAINIGINGDFAPWVGAMLGNTQQAIVLVTNANQLEETITRLSRVGFDHILGHLQGGFQAWQQANKPVASVQRISAADFASAMANNAQAKVLDVRKASEYAATHVVDAYSRPLDALNTWINELNPAEHFYLHCAGGYRSMIAASILQARGYHNFSEVAGGYAAISQTTVPTTAFVCQSKML